MTVVQEMLNGFARNIVGDGGCGDVNLFFFSIGKDVILVTTDFAIAYRAWVAAPPNEYSCLEDRITGVICSVEQDDEGKWWSHNDAYHFGYLDVPFLEVG